MLADAVESILQGYETPTELIIVDQSDVAHPEPAAPTTERPCQLRYHRVQSVGLSRANNYGIDVAQHEILVFTHDDILVSPTWFASLAQALLNAGPRAVVTGRVLPEEGDPPGRFVPSTKTDERPAVYEGRIGVGVLYPMSMAMYRAALDEVGRFDERLGPGTPFPAAEDNDLCFRLLEAGYRIIYAPEAILYHRAWRTERDYIPLRWGYGRGEGAYLAKHLGFRDRYMLRRMMRMIKNHLVRSAGQLRHHRRLAYGDAVFALGILAGAAQWFLTQRAKR
jgi:GT2 family glycosyltransferase